MANELTTNTSAVPSISATGNGIAIGQLNDGLHLHIDGSSPEMIAALTRFFPQTSIQQATSHAIEWASLRTDAFCLFVLENEKYDCGAFSIGRRVALAKYTLPVYKDFFMPLTYPIVEELKQMPCIFAVRNQEYKKTAENHPALLGKLTDVTCQGENIRFRFTCFKPISQQLINEHIREFGLRSTTVRNQLDEEHWSIRSGNLIDVVSRMGITIE